MAQMRKLAAHGVFQIARRVQQAVDVRGYIYRARPQNLTSTRLSDEEKSRGCLTASTGNHGMACAHAFKTLGLDGTIVVPTNASQAKIDLIREKGGSIEQYGTDAAETEAYARKLAQERKMVFISPYNDWDILNGQGTIGVEILQDLPDVDAIFVSVGGGGLIAGIAKYCTAREKSPKIYGCQPSNSAVMMRSIEAGRILEMESWETLSDGTAGGIEQDAITFELCRELVDEFVEVSEDEIIDAMRECIDTHHMMIEGSAGVALACAKKKYAELAGKNVCIVLCGANISRATLKSIL